MFHRLPKPTLWSGKNRIGHLSHTTETGGEDLWGEYAKTGNGLGVILLRVMRRLFR